MDIATAFNVFAGVASILSLGIAISAKSDVKKMQQTIMHQTGSNNRQAGRDFHE